VVHDVEPRLIVLIPGVVFSFRIVKKLASFQSRLRPIGRELLARALVTLLDSERLTKKERSTTLGKKIKAFSYMLTIHNESDIFL